MPDDPVPLMPPGSPGRGFSEALANSLPGVLYLFDAQGRLRWWNREGERVTGYSPQELSGAPISLFVPAEALPAVLDRFHEALLTGTAWVEVPLICKGGERIPHTITGQRL